MEEKGVLGTIASSGLLVDEECHSGRCEPISLGELLQSEGGSEVILHNTMRFDVHLSHIQPVLDDGDVDKDRLVAEIRDAIIKTVDEVISRGLDMNVGSIAGNVLVTKAERSVMLHRETIGFDLS